MQRHDAGPSAFHVRAAGWVRALVRRRSPDPGRPAAVPPATQRFEAMGHLACGIAHDFNNLLIVILSGCDAAEEGLAPGDPVRAHVGEIRHAARQGEAMTRRLLAFCRRAPAPPVAVDLSALVRESELLLVRLLGSHVRIRLDVPAVRPVLGDPGQLQQVLLNLAVNARDAMPHGGVLEVTLRDDPAGEGAVRGGGQRRGRPHVVLAVSDTGTGIDPATRARMFEPLFTTKADGKGTGLGLSVVQAIVTEAGGFIEVTSRLGAGSRFEIYLPASDAPDGPERASDLDPGGE